jgi:hypothetical protein
MKTIPSILEEFREQRFDKNEHGYPEIQWLKIEDFITQQFKEVLESLKEGKLKQESLAPTPSSAEEEAFVSGYNQRNQELNTTISLILGEEKGE